MYNSKDNDRILIAIQNEREFQSFCKNVLGKPELSTDERFSTNVSRCANRQELDGIIQDVFSQHHVGALVERLEEGNIAFANVSTMKGLSEHAALTRIEVRRFIQQNLSTLLTNRFHLPLKVPTEDGPRNVVAPATRFNGKHRELRKVPRLGEHNDFIRAEFAL